MTDWHTRAIIYQIDTALFYDMNGDVSTAIAVHIIKSTSLVLDAP